MRSRLALWLAVLGLACALIAPAEAYAQFPPWLKNCLPFPTFADEIQRMLNEEQARTGQGKLAQPKIRIVAVKYEGADILPETERAQITAKLEEPAYDNDSELIDYSREWVRDALQDCGYLYAHVATGVDVISSNAEEKRVSVSFRVTEGRQYRLAELTFTGAHVFPPSQLRKLVPMQDGDIFSLNKIRRGIENLTRLYGSHGYINFTASPDLRPDSDRRFISLTLQLDEDKQFRVSRVEVLGLEKEVADHAVKMTLQPGEVFSPKLLDDFYEKNKSLLPAGVSLGDFKERTQIGQNTKENTVTVVFDMRHCP